jgi:hypothetical protein
MMFSCMCRAINYVVVTCFIVLLTTVVIRQFIGEYYVTWVLNKEHVSSYVTWVLNKEHVSSYITRVDTINVETPVVFILTMLLSIFISLLYMC